MFRDQRKLVQKTMPPPAGRDGARPLQGARSRAVRPGRRGAPRVWLPPAKFRTEIWGVSHGHPALRKQHWWCLAVGRCGHRPLRREGEVPATTQASGAERSVCASGREEMGGNRSRDHPQRGHQRRTIPQSRRSRDSSLSTREPLGTGGYGLPRRFAPRNDSPDPLSFRGGQTGRRGNPSFLRWTGVRAAGVVGPYAPRGTGERHAGVVVPYGWSQGGLINCRGSA